MLYIHAAKHHGSVSNAWGLTFKMAPRNRHPVFTPSQLLLVGVYCAVRTFFQDDMGMR